MIVQDHPIWPAPLLGFCTHLTSVPLLQLGLFPLRPLLTSRQSSTHASTPALKTLGRLPVDVSALSTRLWSIPFTWPIAHKGGSFYHPCSYMHTEDRYWVGGLLFWGSPWSQSQSSLLRVSSTVAAIPSELCREELKCQVPCF